MREGLYFLITAFCLVCSWIPWGCPYQVSLSEVERLEDEIEADEETEFMVISDQNDMGQVECCIYIMFVHGPSLHMIPVPELSRYASGVEAIGPLRKPYCYCSP